MSFAAVFGRTARRERPRRRTARVGSRTPRTGLSHDPLRGRRCAQSAFEASCSGKAHPAGAQDRGDSHCIVASPCRLDAVPESKWSSAARSPRSVPRQYRCQGKQDLRASRAGSSRNSPAGGRSNRSTAVATTAYWRQSLVENRLAIVERRPPLSGPPCSGGSGPVEQARVEADDRRARLLDPSRRRPTLP